MEALFIQILNMSMSASWLILAVIFIRFFLQKAPKGFRYVLWALVAVRLLCPVFFESDFSLLPGQGILSGVGDAVVPVTPVNPGSDAVTNDAITNDDVQNDGVQNDGVQNDDVQNDGVQNNDIQSNTTQNNTASNSTSQNLVVTKTDLISVVMCMWMCGILVLFMYAAVSYIRLYNTIKVSVYKGENVWVCDNIQTPFILGLLRPRIYLPSYIEECHVPYIVAHENEHIRLRDNWWKVLGYMLLMVHWFNPLVWAAYILMCRDIETACDERVIRTMGVEDKKNYSKSLLFCSRPGNFVSACPVAFGEVGVKERIRKIVDYRKPSAWIITIAVILCLIMAFGFMTNPKQNAKDVAWIELGRVDGKITWADITDADTIQQIIDGINELSFVPISPNFSSGEWRYAIKMYDADGNMIDQMSILDDNRVEKGYFVYASLNGKFNTRYYDKLIAKAEFQRLENLQSGLEDFTGNGKVEEHQGEKETQINLISDELMSWFHLEYFDNVSFSIAKHFLTDVYTTPEDINLYELFYRGAYTVGSDGMASEEEKQLLLERYLDKIYAQVFRITTKEMNDVLQKYMGITLEETNKYGLDKMYYLEEYDAYYIMHDDTNWFYAIFQAGKINADGTITLQYYRSMDDGSPVYWVTLKETDGKYYIISNIMVESE